MFTAPAAIVGTHIGTDNTGSVAETVRNDALGVFFRLLSCRLAVALGGGSGTSPESRSLWDSHHEDGHIIAEAVLLEFANGLHYSVCDGLGVEASADTEESFELLLSKESAVRGAGLVHAVGIEHQGVAGPEAGLLLGEVRIVEHADGAARVPNLADAPVGPNQDGCGVTSSANGYPYPTICFTFARL